VTDPADATLAAYQSRAQEYLRGTTRSPELNAYLDQFAALARPGPVLEIGSGPGWDAEYLESRGVRVIRTDATPAFVALLRAAGHDARLLDARTDPLGGPYQGILANAVLLHLSRDQFGSVLRRARTATAVGGVLGFTLKEGDGAGWSDHKLGVPRHFTYWREPAVRTALHRAGWPDVSVTHVAGRENWLYVLARTSTTLRRSPSPIPNVWWFL
jgi:SAM-dependent methyltransferase